MKKTFITNMPDKAGAFLRAGSIITEEGANMSRVSYNKAVDAHLLFIEVEADASTVARITARLAEIGYLSSAQTDKRTLLAEFRLEDKPGALLPIVEAISRRNLNISYMSSQGDGSQYQFFRIGFLVESESEVSDFLDEVSKLCRIRILDSASGERNLDNTIFYITFAGEISEMMGLSQEDTESLIINSNRIMQMLDERDQPIYRTFELIEKFAAMLRRGSGEGYHARRTVLTPSPRATVYIYEPPCGSNTYVIRIDDNLLFVDCGFPLYHDELLAGIRADIPDFDALPKSIVITHADIDHCGFLDEFDRVYMSRTAAENFALERAGDPNYRELNRTHEPYCIISKLLSGYKTPAGDNFVAFSANEMSDALVRKIGEFTFGGETFELLEGAGGHVKGEIAIVCRALGLAFTGDIAVNLHGFTPEQKAFNAIAPVLMAGTDTDVDLARAVRAELYRILRESGVPTVCPGHGAPFVL